MMPGAYQGLQSSLERHLVHIKVLVGLSANSMWIRIEVSDRRLLVDD